MLNIASQKRSSSGLSSDSVGSTMSVPVKDIVMIIMKRIVNAVMIVTVILRDDEGEAWKDSSGAVQ